MGYEEHPNIQSVQNSGGRLMRNPGAGGSCGIWPKAGSEWRATKVRRAITAGILPRARSELRATKDLRTVFIFIQIL